MINAVTIKTVSQQNVADGQPGDVALQQTNADRQAEFETLIAEQQGNLPLPTDNFSGSSATDSQQVLLSEQAIAPENPAAMHRQNENSELQNDAIKLDNPLLLQSKMLALAMTDSLSTVNTLTMDATTKATPPGLDQAPTTGKVVSILNVDPLPATPNVQPILPTVLRANQLSERYISPLPASVSIAFAGESQSLNRYPQSAFAPSAFSPSTQPLTPVKISANIDLGKMQPFTLQQFSTSIASNSEPPLSRLTSNFGTLLSSGFELTRPTLASESVELKPAALPLNVADLAAPSPATLVPGQNLAKESEHLLAATTASDKVTVSPGSNLTTNAARDERLIANQQSAQLLHLSNNGQFNEVKIKDNNLGEMHFSVSGKQAEQLGVFAVQQHSQLLMQQHLFELKADLTSQGLTEFELFSSTEQQQQHKQQHFAEQAKNYADIEDSLNQPEKQSESHERSRSVTERSSLDITV